MKHSISLFTVQIWRSFRTLPLWVQLWIAVVLVPVNLAAPFFVRDAPNGAIIAFLAVAGIAPNAFVLFFTRGFPKSMAFSHLVFWTPLLVFLWPILGAPYLTLLFATNVVSLVFDVRDAWLWLRGDRSVPGA